MLLYMQVLLVLEPCAMNAPHVHPRSPELLHVLSGKFESVFIEENGGEALKNELKPLMS